MLENEVKQRRGKINKNILIAGIASGMTYAEAGKLAGSQARTPELVKKSVYNVLNREVDGDRPIKRTLIEKLEAFQHKVMDSIKDDEIERASLSQKMVGLGISVEKSQLLKGDPTQRIAVMPKMVIDEIEAPIKGEIVEPKQIEGGLK